MTTATLLKAIFCFCIVASHADAQWVRIGLTDRNVYALWAKGDTLLAGSDSGRIYRSTDIGVSWLQTMTFMPRNNIVLSFLDTNGVIYAAAGYSTFTTCAGCGGVFRSTDRGLSWQPINAGFPTNLDVHTVFPYDNKLFAGASAGLFTTFVNNISWSRVDSALSDVYYILCSTVNLPEIYIGSDSYGIYRSSSGGLSWQRFSQGLPRYPDSNYFAIGALAALGDTIYAAAWGAGVYQKGSTMPVWKALNSGLSGSENLYIGSFVATHTNIFANTIRRVYFLPRGDSVWRDFTQGLDIPFPGASISVIHKNQRYLFAGVQGIGRGVWRRPLSDIVSVNEQINGEGKEKLSLDQNYPNPFNATTTIRFQITNTNSSKDQFVSLRVFDVLGRVVTTLVETLLPPGTYNLNLDGSNLASGVYVYRLTVGEFNASKKLMLLR